MGALVILACFGGIGLAIGMMAFLRAFALKSQGYTDYAVKSELEWGVVLFVAVVAVFMIIGIVIAAFVSSFA